MNIKLIGRIALMPLLFFAGLFLGAAGTVLFTLGEFAFKRAEVDQAILEIKSGSIHLHTNMKTNSIAAKMVSIWTINDEVMRNGIYDLYSVSVYANDKQMLCLWTRNDLVIGALSIAFGRRTGSASDDVYYWDQEAMERYMLLRNRHAPKIPGSQVEN